MNPSDKVALIIGAKRLGAAVALELARRGADICISYNRSQDHARRAVVTMQALGRKAIAMQANVSRAEECQRLIDSTVAEFGRLDILVNMASTYETIPFDELTLDHWDRALAVDLTGAFLCSRAAVPHMRRVGGGRIVNCSDWVARSGRPRYPGFLPYYVAKSAVVGLTEALAFELAADGILVNAIAPGPIIPPSEMSAQEVEAVAKATPLGRWGGAEEIAKVVVALVESDFVTGETVRVDGGRHLK